MHDSRIDQLAAQLVNYSTEVAKGEKVLIDLFDVPDAIGIALIREVRKAGGIPFINNHVARLSREIAMGVEPEQADTVAELALAQMEKMDCYIAVRGAHNVTELSDVPEENMKRIAKAMRPVLNYRVGQTRWCVLRWPHPSMAQQAQMSTEAFEDFYFRVCLLDYPSMVEGMKALKARMDAAKDVHLVGPGTDLKFSIDGLQSIWCGGRHNIPDGECFTSPVKDSVEGKISYNATTVYQGKMFNDVVLEFEKGKIVSATASDTDAINKILDSDEGSRYIGEFAIAFNNEILQPMGDILFDEKIGGSFHFTPGQAYEGVADNGNRSQVHWDLVNIQRPDYGGGEIWFDGELLRKDGLFLPDDLQSLNP